MKYFAQCSYTFSDGTYFHLSKEFESCHDAVNWIVSYMILHTENNFNFDIFPIFDELEVSE